MLPYKFYLFLIAIIAMCDLLQGTCSQDVYNKKWEGMKNENSIFKSKIDYLAEIFRMQLESLKNKSKNQVEMVLLIDASSSIGEENFNCELQFLRKLLADFPISPTDTRVAIVTFGTEVIVHVNHLEPLQNATDKCSLLNLELTNIAYSGGNTFTRGALEAALEIIKLSNRPDAVKVIFLVTDGFSNNGRPEPIADALKWNGCIIFTFGIKNGNVDELRNIASTPWNSHAFLLESFTEFEALARKALHNDRPQGKYATVSDQSLCKHLCNGHYCCGENATCACGKSTGHYTCLCPPGYYGLGLIDQPCKPCLEGTYYDGSAPGDHRVCRPCPDQNHKTKKFPATSIKDCVCNEGFIPVNNKCEVISCPRLLPPKNGYFVNKKCQNVLHAACGVQCNIGFDLIGPSVRICQKNSTWSGTNATCVFKKCTSLLPSPNAEMQCSHEEEGLQVLIQFGSQGQKIRHIVKRPPTLTNLTLITDNWERLPVDTQCRFSCPQGFSHLGSKTRNCLPITKWDGLKTICKPITCPSIPQIANGKISPENCTESNVKHKYGSVCEISCNDGFKLKSLNSTRHCTGRHGTWTGKSFPYKCLDITPPALTCPLNISLHTNEGQSFSTANLSLPEAYDNSEVKPIVWSQPPLGLNVSSQFLIGETLIHVYAVDATGNVATCSFHIIVQDNEPPKMEMCNSSKLLTLEELFNVDWDDPIISDNSGNFSLDIVYGFGRDKSAQVTYTATDPTGNKANCSISVTLKEAVCDTRPKPKNADVNCEEENGIVSCSIQCKPGFISNTNVTKFSCVNHTWNTDLFDGTWNQYADCLEVENKFLEKSIQYSVQGIDICENNNFTELYKILKIQLNDTISVDISCELEDEKTRKIRTIISKNKSIKLKLYINSESLFWDSNRIDNLIKTYFNGHDVSLNNQQLFCMNGSAPLGNVCVKCGLGYFHDMALNQCLPCPAGQYQESEGETECMICPTDLSTAKTTAKKKGDCKKLCPKGKFGKRKYYAYLAVEPCKLCRLGSYQDLKGGKDCKKCPEGTTTPGKGSTHISDCKINLNPCHENKCLNGGKCVLVDFYPTCLCANGYLGSFCEHFFDPCSTNPCLNDGTCQSQNLTHYFCKCQPGYTDLTCQKEENLCLSSPCLNGGSCINVLNDFFCQCLDNFYGKTCNLSLCSDISLCLNNGKCIVDETSGNLTCVCPQNFSGKYCEKIEFLQNSSSVKTIVHDDFCLKNCKFSECSFDENFYVCKNSSVIPVNSTVSYSPNVIISFTRPTTSTYLSSPLSGKLLNDISATFWVQMSDNINFGTIFSYATKLYDNAFTLNDFSGLVLFLNGERIITDIQINDNIWHFICITWNVNSGSWQIFVDKMLKAHGEVLENHTPLNGNGEMVIGQDQDFVGGGFTQVEAFLGNITLIDFWGEIITEAEIAQMYDSCDIDLSGDLLSWSTLIRSIHGNLKVIESSFCSKCGPGDDILRNGLITEKMPGFYLYTCNPGFSLKFRDEGILHVQRKEWIRKCLKTGEWEGTSPICVRINCGFPGFFPNGFVKGRSYLFEESLYYSCHDGYILVGESNRTCLEYGNWSSRLPTCQKYVETFCPELTAPWFGSMFFVNQPHHSFSNQFIPGDSVEFQCNFGYILKGSSTLLCLEGYVWNTSIPTCIPAPTCFL